MRVLFVGGTETGGSGFSHREYATGLSDRGHNVDSVVMRRGRLNPELWLYRQLRTRTQRDWVPRWIRRLGRCTYERLGRTPKPFIYGDYRYLRSPVPENTLAWFCQHHKPDVVVVRLLSPRSLVELSSTCEMTGTPWAYLIAEDMAIDHLVAAKVRPDLAIGTALTHVRRLAAAGYASVYVPRILDVRPTQVSSTRSVVLQVNPSPLLGGDIFWQLAALLPDLPFVLQESWPLGSDELDEVSARASALPNVEFRRFQTERRLIYRDVRILLAPHQVDNNPRVASEAQANGIPVLASDLPGLQEVVGEGGCLVPPDAPIERWVAELLLMWNDGDFYDRLSSSALKRSRGAEMLPVHAVDRLEEELFRLSRDH